MAKDINAKDLLRRWLENGNPEDMQPGNEKVVHPQIKMLPFHVNEALNVLRGNIQMSGYHLKVIAVTSALPHEGKSSIAFYLACSMAGLNKKVLYLDCDIRNSKTVARYNITGKKLGLSEYLCGMASIDSIIYHTENLWLDMILTGSIVPNPSELLSGKQFRDLMSYVHQEYDYVIADTPPLNTVIDGLLVAKQCDGAILVVESGLTERSQAQKAKEQLQYADIRVLGAVLNKVDVGRHGYGYGYGYGRSTDREEQNNGKKQDRKKYRQKKK